MSYNGFTHAVANGEITSLKEFFWHYVSLNRRDHNGDEPIVLYKWNDDHELAKIAEKEAELAKVKALNYEYWEKELKSSRASTSARYAEYDQKSLEEVARVQALITQFEESCGLAPVLVEWHEHVVKMLHESVTHNTPRDRTEQEYTPEEFKAMMIDCEELSVKNSLEKYESRKTKCRDRSDFLSAAIERYGEPAQGIKVVDSSEMW